MGARESPGEARIDGLLLPWVLGYFAAYLGYLFLHAEDELAHWLTLVAAPLIGVWWLSVRSRGGGGFASVLNTVGLRRPPGGRGLRAALVLSLMVQIPQLLSHVQRTELAETLASPSALWVVPTALALALTTAAFTEEVFFRGIIQGTVTRRTGSPLLGIAVTTVAFTAYHVPYAFEATRGPTGPDITDAFLRAATNGIPAGLVLGLLCRRADGSILPPILLHAAVDWLPALRLLARV